MPKIVDYESRRRDIVEALWRIVSRDGFGKVSVRTVAAEAGLPATTVAAAFASRTELLVSAYSGLAGQTDSRIAKMAERPPSIDLLVEAALLAMPLTSERAKQSSVWIGLIDAAPHDPAAAEALSGLNAAVREQVVHHISRARDAGVLRKDIDVEAEALVVHAMIDGFSAQFIGTGSPKKATIQGAVRAHFNALVP